ncbi:hypothetical protein PFLUV_G00115020 [Perca fluviatilis]|uniref:Uncharacterized protein n=1 Tax=Perca fluviatilis TaxID=8168 RepID=A0A6A5F6X2_PERFL|nr:hypothetical protein PFLUV_G00115020 [Perca fluviatilis]
MRTFQSRNQPAQRGASSCLPSLSSSSSGAVSPLSTASVTLTALLILTIPVCKNAVCSSYLSTDLKFWASDILGELCVLMLVQKSKELKVRENSKRFLNSEEKKDSQCALNSRDLGESRAEVTSSIGHEMEDDP